MKRQILLSALMFTAGMAAAEANETLALHAECKKAKEACMEIKNGDETLSVEKEPSLVIHKDDVLYIQDLSAENPYHQGGFAPDQEALLVNLREDLAKKLETVTTQHVHERLAIIVGEKLISAPQIKSPIKEGSFRLVAGKDQKIKDYLKLFPDWFGAKVLGASSPSNFKLYLYLASGIALLLMALLYAFYPRKLSSRG